MSSDALVLTGLVLLASIGLGWSCHYEARHAAGRIPRGNKPLYLPRFAWWMVLLVCIWLDWPKMFTLLYVKPMLLLCIYVGLLLLLLPLLRRVLRAQSCATLWGIIILIFGLGVFSSFPPLFVVSLPIPVPGSRAVRTLLWIWLAGFGAVMLGSLVSHLLFRRRILRDAALIWEGPVFDAFVRQRLLVNLPSASIRLYASPRVKTPLSIGLFRSTTCILLPRRGYTSEELALIFRHELIHITRRDSMQKLFMTFCTAAQWFNPLMWLAMHACAEDLELSCDEAVLCGYESEVRRQYAQLLLKTAGDHRGFTTCLSASAKALRYRLRGVVKPGRHIVGGAVVGVLSFLLLFSGFFVGVRFRPMAAEELVFNREDLHLYSVGDVFSTLDGADLDGECEDDQALLRYISGIALRWSTGKYKVYDQPRVVQITAYAPGKNYSITFGGHYLRVIKTTFLDDGSRRQSENYYELDSEPDWAFLLSCIEPR